LLLLVLEEPDGFLELVEDLPEDDEPEDDVPDDLPLAFGVASTFACCDAFTFCSAPGSALTA
jgi:hypothetical protein